MDQARRVNDRKRFRQAAGRPPYRLVSKRPARRDKVRERRAWHEGGGQPGDGIVGSRRDHRRRVNPAHLPCGRDLAAKPFAESLIDGEFRVDELDGDGAPGRRESEEHAPHPATAKPVTDPELANLGWITGLQRGNPVEKRHGLCHRLL
jgi:hypothetical protein